MQGKEGGVLVFRSGRMLKCKTAWWKSMQQGVDRRLQSQQVRGIQEKWKVQAERQRGRGKHKSVRAVVIGNDRGGIGFYKGQCKGVMEALVRRKGGVRGKLVLVFQSEGDMTSAIVQACLQGSEQYFRLVPATSNRIHANSEVEFKWFA